MSNFDTVFTAEAPLDSVVEGSQLSQTVQAQFAGMLPFPAAASLLQSDHPLAQASPMTAPTCPSAPSNAHCFFHLHHSSPQPSLSQSLLSLLTLCRIAHNLSPLYSFFLVMVFGCWKLSLVICCASPHNPNLKWRSLLAPRTEYILYCTRSF